MLLGGGRTMFARLSTRRRAFAPLARGLATQARGRAEVLAKRPDDVVITFAKRTALGRAKKGQLKDVPVDELLHALFKVRDIFYAWGLVANLTASVLGVL